MKRVLNALDHVLVTLWSLMLLFVFVTLAYRALPERWQADVEMKTTVELSGMVLCVLSTIRFLAFMEYPQWVWVPNVALVIFIYWVRPGAALSWWELSVVGSMGSLVVALLFIPLHKWAPIKIKMRMPWQKKQHKAAKLAQQALDLKAQIQKSNVE